MIGFAVFFLVSMFGLMLVFKFSTYHRYFWIALPVLLGYSALVAWALFSFGMHSFFIWELVLAAIWLFITSNHQKKTAEAMLEVSDDPDEVRLISRSIARTSTYYTASSLIFLSAFSLTYLWLYNSQPWT